MRATNSRTDSPPSRPDQRSSAGRPRSSAYASAAFSAGVPCHLGSRISSNQGSISSSRPSRASSGPAVCRARTRGDTSTSSNISFDSSWASCSAWAFPRSVSGGSTTFSPPRTHSGSPWRTSTISIVPIVRTVDGGPPHSSGHTVLGTQFWAHSSGHTVPGVRPPIACPHVRSGVPARLVPGPDATVRVPVPQRDGLDRRRLVERRSLRRPARHRSRPHRSEPGGRNLRSCGCCPIGSRRRLDDPRHHRCHHFVAAVHRRPRSDLRRARHRVRSRLAPSSTRRIAAQQPGARLRHRRTHHRVARRRPVRGRGDAFGGRPAGGRPRSTTPPRTRSLSPRANSTGRSPP